MNEDIERLYWSRVSKFLPILQIVPGLRMVAVCNNLAFGKVDDESDIDLFIVAREGRLFTVRLFVTLLLQLRGVRRHGKKVAGRFCLSFFVDDSALNLSDVAIENDVYLAYWIKSMLPVIDDGVSRDFAEANRWVEDYFEFPTLKISRKRVFDSRKFFSFCRFLYKWTIDLLLGWFVEFVLEFWQLARARKKADVAGESASLIVNEHILKFHNIDRRSIYRDMWKERFGEEKLSKKKFLLL